ncbi:MAG: transcriptional repressor [Candidatus Kerfeldbacteria bacterium]
MQASSRHTTQRRRILAKVKKSAAPLSAEEIIRAEPGFARATVFRNLDLLAKRGEIVVVETNDGVRRYIGHSSHEAVFHCQRCGKTRRLSSKTLDDYVQRKMDGAQVVFYSQLIGYGLCTSCAATMKLL